MKKLTLASFLLSSTLLALTLRADTPPASSAAEATAAAENAAPKKIEIPGITLTHGPATVKLGKVAELKLPDGFAFVGPDSLDKFFALTQNTRGGNEVGVVLSPGRWMLFFYYDDVGYIKDDEKKDLDAKKLYQTMDEGQNAANEARKERGWDELKLQGWATEPYYDEKTHNLKWAIKISSSSDQHQSVGVNESIRLLGRGGVIKATLVGDYDKFKEQETEANRLLADFSFVQGETYAEFKKGDKVAKYGLAALVVGGAGVVAAKTGLLAKLGVLLAKGGKAIILGLVGIGAVFARFFKKIIGRDKVD